VTKPREVDGRTVKGINFFEPGDSALLHALQNPRVNIAGIRRGDLLPDLGMFSPTRLSRQLRRLLDIGVIKRVTGTYRYYLTKAGRAAAAAAGRLTEAVIVPARSTCAGRGRLASSSALPAGRDDLRPRSAGR
jgi:DNA-binding HxlR family transcriptional regulator